MIEQEYNQDSQPNLFQMREILRLLMKDNKFKKEDIPNAVKKHFKDVINLT